MADTPRPTPVDKYALGRNSFLSVFFLDKTTNRYTIGFSICISEGSVSLDTDTIEINSNCQSGWKVKLPGLKSGTASFTGYIASSVSNTPGPGGELVGEPTSGRNKFDILQYLGQPCLFYCVALQSPSQTSFAAPGSAALDSGQNEVPFSMCPTGTSEGTSSYVPNANGFFKTGSVTISPDDAVKVSMSVELSGRQVLSGFVAVGRFYDPTKPGLNS